MKGKLEVKTCINPSDPPGIRRRNPPVLARSTVHILPSICTVDRARPISSSVLLWAYDMLILESDPQKMTAHWTSVESCHDHKRMGALSEYHTYNHVLENVTLSAVVNANENCIKISTAQHMTAM